MKAKCSPTRIGGRVFSLPLISALSGCGGGGTGGHTDPPLRGLFR